MSALPLLLTIPTVDYDMSDDLENLRLVIRLIEEMDAYFAKHEPALKSSELQANHANTGQ